jgi:transposase
MANKPISMGKVRQIIKLHSKGISRKTIAKRLAMSKNTVKHYINFFSGLRTTWEELSKKTDKELNDLFHPPQQVAVNPKVKELVDFFPVMDKELRRRGMTVAIQYRKFKAQHPETFGPTRFYHYYNRWKQKVNPTMHVEHKVGDKAYLDFAGGTLPYVDEDTGEIKEAQVFVGTLGWSQYSYVEAMRSQTVEEFIAATENTFKYFKGCPLAVVPDNLKSAVFKPNKYEPMLNENFAAFAEHYGVTIVPARVRRPQDKSHVENMVKITYQRIYTNIPEGKLYTLTELNTLIRQWLCELNDAPLTGKNCSRTDQWLLEIPSLQALPEKGYEMRKIKLATVMKNGYVYLTEDQHYYSVPYELIGDKLKLQYSRSVVEIYKEYELIASHKRVRSPHNYTTDPAHMHPNHRYVMEWSPTFFIEKAKQIDPVVELFIRQVLEKKQYPQEAYRSCQGILSFGRRVGNKRLIKACKRAHEIGYYNYRIIEDILKKGLDRYEDDPQPAAMPVHQNIRGAGYYNDNTNQ